MVNSLDDAKRSFYVQQIPGALPTMSVSDLEALFFTNPSAYLKSSSWTEDEIGFKGWTYDPIICSTGAALIAGLLYLNRIKMRKSALITGLAINVQAAGITLTAGQNFAGLWRADGTLVAITVDQSGTWNSPGYQTMPLVGGPFQLAAGDYYAGLWANGATPPAFFRSTNSGPNMVNGQLTASNFRICTANAALTTTPPNPFGAQNPVSNSPWFGLY